MRPVAAEQCPFTPDGHGFRIDEPWPLIPRSKEDENASIMTVRRILLLAFFIGIRALLNAQTFPANTVPVGSNVRDPRTSGLLAYPDPCDDVLHVNVPFSERRPVIIDLYPLYGSTVVIHETMNYTPVVNLVTTNVPDGIYTLVIRQTGENGRLLGAARVVCSH
jgi:hypothetical protein